jgi:hypothetical protein
VEAGRVLLILPEKSNKSMKSTKKSKLGLILMEAGIE